MAIIQRHDVPQNEVMNNFRRQETPTRKSTPSSFVSSNHTKQNNLNNITYHQHQWINKTGHPLNKTGHSSRNFGKVKMIHSQNSNMGNVQIENSTTVPFATTLAPSYTTANQKFSTITTTTKTTPAPIKVNRRPLIISNPTSGYSKDQINYYDFKNFNGTLSTNALSNPAKLWPNGIVYYEIKDLFTNEERKNILNGMKEFHDKTCIKFLPRNQQRDYIVFDKRIGCMSDVGRRKGKQIVSLASEACLAQGSILHELMHVVGFFHEHERIDRDKYIHVLWPNIIQAEYWQFVIVPSRVPMTISYDYSSILHYGKFAFSKNGKPTIESKMNNDYIGQIKGFSQIDLFEINVLYKCSKRAN